MKTKNNKILIIGLAVAGIVLLAGILKFNFSDRDIYTEGPNGKMMQIDEAEKMMGDGDKMEAMEMNSEAMMKMDGDKMEMDMDIKDGKMMMDDNFSAIKPEMFKKMYEDGGYVAIDVRTPEEIAAGKVIANALEIDFYDADFREQINKLDKSKKYLVNCRSGARSGKTMKIMQELGFETAYDLAGGINAWNAKGYKAL